MRRRDWLVAALVALVTVTASAHPRLGHLEGFSTDALFWLRHQLFGQRHPPEASPAVVVAIDEETFDAAFVCFGAPVRFPQNTVAIGGQSSPAAFRPAVPPPLAPGMTLAMPAPDPTHRHQLKLLRLN